MLQVGEKKEHGEGRREVKREEVRSFAAAGAFIILSVSSNEETPPHPHRRTPSYPLFTRAFLVFNFPAQPSGHFESSYNI